MKLKTICTRLDGLVIFRGLLEDPIIAKFHKMLVAGHVASEANNEEYLQVVIRTIAEFESVLFESTTNWTAYLRDAVLDSENICIRRAASGGAGEILEACLAEELSFLQELSQMTFDAFASEVAGRNSKKMSFLPPWQITAQDLKALYVARLAVVSQKGYGMFAKYHVFTVEGGKLVPVKYPDPQTLAQLPGYEGERKKILSNTEALLAGKPANNVLLYGDAGTGKSSAVKAIANEYASQGLRLIEVKKNQLYQIPDIMENLAANPLKFILFIDDLTFTANDDNFAALKAILEGSVCGRTNNLAIYATSNRRHLIKEMLSDRTGDDIHESDTRQELMSLAARFGLTVTFQKPEKVRYQSIVAALAQQYGVVREERQLMIQAEAFALRAGGRSPRVAKQFIELCKAGVQ